MKNLIKISPQNFKLLKLILSAGGIIYITLRIWNQLSGNDFIFLFTESNKLSLLIAAFALMPVNWLAESVKWKTLITPIEKINIKTSVSGILSGLAVAMFTPNRSGDFAGRILMLPAGKRGKGVLATWIGNIAQIACTIIFGIIGGAFLLKNNAELPDKWLFNKTGLSIALASLIVLIVTYWFIARRSSTIFKSKRVRQFLQFTSAYKNTDLIKVFGISLFRYSVFSTQFYLTLLIFNVEISALSAYVSIFTIYGIMLFLPIITLFEYPVRGSVSIMVLSLFTESVTQVAVASLLLWIINLGIPAIAGSVLWNRVKK